jgi:NAD(P)H-flavin reductase
VTADPMLPRPFRVIRVKRELSDTVTLTLEPVNGEPLAFRPGQFTMLYAFGIGEIPISISGDPADPRQLVHTIRGVGAVSQALTAAKPGMMVGVRGPFGSAWPLEEATGSDVVLVAGGIGLAPLRPAIHRVLANRRQFGTVAILYGARTPEDILFRRELQAWRGRFDTSVHVIVDRVSGSWGGAVGVVTDLIAKGGFDRHHAVAMICGPEVMMRYAVQALHERGVASDRIHLSLERNMKCAIGLCGHCQLAGNFVCRDGPVFRYDRIEDIINVWEL